MKLDITEHRSNSLFQDRDEAELIELAKTDRRAFGELYERHYTRILGYLFRRVVDLAVAEELTSNTFFNALRSLPRYEHRGCFQAWLYRIATNEIRAYHRSAAKRRERPSPTQNELERVYFESSGNENSADIEEDLREFAELHEAIRCLPDKYQTAISLRYFEEMPYSEIAEVMERPAGTVKSLVHRGLRRLKRHYRCDSQ